MLPNYRKSTRIRNPTTPWPPPFSRTLKTTSSGTSGGGKAALVGTALLAGAGLAYYQHERRHHIKEEGIHTEKIVYLCKNYDT